MSTENTVTTTAMAGGATEAEAVKDRPRLDWATTPALHTPSTAPATGPKGPQSPTPPAWCATSPALAVDLGEAARLLSVSLHTVTRLRDAGKLRCAKVGRLWRVRRAEIDAFLKRQEDSA